MMKRWLKEGSLVSDRWVQKSGLMIMLVFMSMAFFLNAATAATASKIAAGVDHTVAIKSDGTLWAWGCGASVSDNFNRANSSSLGSNWTSVPGWSAPRITSNAVACVTEGNEADAYWSGTFSWTAAQYSQIQITTLPAGHNDCGTGTNTSSSTNQTGYFCAYSKLSGAVHLYWGRNVNGGNSIDLQLPATVAVNDTVKEVYDGYNVQCYINGTLVYSRPDQTITGTYGAGYPYIGGAAAACRLDNFVAGNVSAYTLGSDPALVSGTKAWYTDFTGTSHTSISTEYAGAVTAGNTLVTTVAWYGQSAAPTVTDTLGQTWTLASFVYDLRNTAGIAVYYFPGTAAGVPTVTASWGASSVTYQGMTLAEFSGIMANNPSIPIDTTSTRSTTWTSQTTNNVATAGMATSANKELIYTGIFIFSNNSTISAAGTGFTMINQNTTGSMTNIFGDAYQVQSAFANVAGQFSATWTSGTGAAMISAVAFFKH